MTSNHLWRIASAMLVTSALALNGGRAFGVDTPYAGQQNRSIKSLSDQDVGALLAGQGAGLAKAAELNGYPGPSHVLELATALHLSASQLRATQELRDQHRERARKLGSELVDAEAELDQLFQHKHAAPDVVDRATEKIALLQARLRAEHLKAHLTQAALLDPQQTRLYQSLRGYGDPESAKDIPVPAHQHQDASGRQP